jgi:hypothetical protein
MRAGDLDRGDGIGQCYIKWIKARLRRRTCSQDCRDSIFTGT